VRVISSSTLREFWQTHTDAEQALRAWYAEVAAAIWTQPSEIKASYRTASLLGNRRVVFNIKGNRYRLVAAIHYEHQIVYVKFVGTHSQYDQIDAGSVDLK
jgi:mRNA interferase HigB